MLKRYKELKAKEAEGTISEPEKAELAKLENDTEETTETVEVSKGVMDALAKTVGEMVKSEVGTAVAQAIEANEKTVKKSIGSGNAKGGEGAGEISKEQKLVKYLKALNGDASALAEYKAVVTQNETDAEDGGALVAPEEFIAEVRRLEEQYGVALRNANIRRTNAKRVTSRKKTAGVTVYKVGELVKGTASKMQFKEVGIDVEKYLGISVLSTEIEEDSATDIWSQLSIDFAREFAKTQDGIVFTDATTGILNITGTNEVVTENGTFDSLSFDDLSLAVDGVPTPSASNGKFYMHRTILGVVRRIKDKNDNYIWQPGVNGNQGSSVWGYAYELTEVMPKLADSATDTGFIVFGDLKNFDLIIRNQMTMEILTQGIVETGDGEINLNTQDAKALRARQRMAGEAIFPEAFSVIKTAEVVS